MIKTVTCPSCGAGRTLDDAERASTLELRCGDCGRTFVVEPDPLVDGPFGDFDAFMGTLRSQLNAPAPDAAAIVLATQRVPKRHDREVAQRYAWEHFRRIGARRDVLVYDPMAHAPMHYDPTTRMLSGSDGTDIKELCCPLTKRWSDLEVLDANDMARACAACKRRVFDTRAMKEADVRRMVAHDPTVCLHIDARHGNVVFATRSPSSPGADLDEHPLIATAHSLHEVNFGAMIGMRPILKRLSDRDGTHFLSVWQNTRTREIMLQMDPRHAPIPLPYDEWEVAIPGFRWANEGSSPFGAYMIPRGLAPNTPVRLERVLRDPEMRREAFATSRTFASRGVWTGRDIAVHSGYWPDDGYQVIG